jgi:hypothetical protein
MDALPFLQEFLTALDRHGYQPSHIGPLDTDARHDLGRAIRPKKVDFRLSCSGDVDMGRFVVERVDDEPEAMSPMDDNHDPM